MEKQQLLQTLSTLVDQASVAFIASVGQDGFPACKAMLPPRKHEGLHTFYFTTNTSSHRVAQYRANPKAGIYFCDGDSFQGALLSGTMEVCEDQPTKQMIWHEGDEQYYPQGVTDPDYCVLRFTAFKARYYCDFHSEDIDIEP